MKVRSAFRVASAVALGISLVASTARAGDQLQVAAIGAPAVTADATPVNTTNFVLLKSGKFKVKPSKTDGAAVDIQLTLSKVDCPPDNDAGAAGKCGPLATPKNAALDLSVHQFISWAVPGYPAGPDLMHVAGVPIHFTQGKLLFDATGTNKADGAVTFGGFVGAFFNQPFGLHVTLLRSEGSSPIDCTTVPLGAGNGCLDGVEFGLTGLNSSPAVIP